MAWGKVDLCGLDTSKLPVLTPQRMQELYPLVHSGDKAARDEFIQGNLRLVLSVIQRFSGRGENVDDLFQVGCIGLMKALDNFDVSQNVRFSTYAVPMVIGEIRRYLRDNNAIRVSRSMRDTAYKALRARDRLQTELSREPTVEEIAADMHIDRMDVVLAHPEGYEVMGGVEEVARRNAAATGGSFARTNDMAEAFAGADIVYPKSWAPFAAMQQRTALYGAGDMDGIKKLEKELLAQNADHKDWCCTEELMKTTKDGKALMASTRNGEALYMHCLPADISGVSCAEGEVAASVFDRYRVPLYKEASYKPYIIAAMITLARKRNPADLLLDLLEKGGQRCL